MSFCILCLHFNQHLVVNANPLFELLFCFFKRLLHALSTGMLKAVGGGGGSEGEGDLGSRIEVDLIWNNFLMWIQRILRNSKIPTRSRVIVVQSSGGIRLILGQNCDFPKITKIAKDLGEMMQIMWNLAQTFLKVCSKDLSTIFGFYLSSYGQFCPKTPNLTKKTLYLPLFDLKRRIFFLRSQKLIRMLDFGKFGYLKSSIFDFMAQKWPNCGHCLAPNGPDSRIWATITQERVGIFELRKKRWIHNKMFFQIRPTCIFWPRTTPPHPTPIGGMPTPYIPFISVKFISFLVRNSLLLISIFIKVLKRIFGCDKGLETYYLY